MEEVEGLGYGGVGIEEKEKNVIVRVGVESGEGWMRVQGDKW